MVGSAFITPPLHRHEVQGLWDGFWSMPLMASANENSDVASRAFYDISTLDFAAPESCYLAALP
jgi:hypothetical protein